jgi:hypothetical protein
MITYRFLWKAHGDGVRVFKWTGKNDYVALCEPESISFGGGCVPTCFIVSSRLTVLAVVVFFTEMVITGYISMKRFTKGRPHVALHSTTIRSAPRNRDKLVVPPRSNASVSKFGV